MTAQNQAMLPLQTVVEVARYLRVHPATIYRLLSKRTIAEFRSGGNRGLARGDNRLAARAARRAL